MALIEILDSKGTRVAFGNSLGECLRALVSRIEADYVDLERVRDERDRLQKDRDEIQRELDRLKAKPEEESAGFRGFRVRREDRE